jgi:KDO2-lipid IV(A) lauroyltransferase
MFFLKFLSLLPLSFLYLLSDILIFFASKVFRYRKKVILQNLRKSFPEKSEKELQEICSGFYKNLSDILVEILSLLSLSSKGLGKRVKIVNPALPESFLSKNQPIIVLAGHLCNWEWLLSGCMVHFKYPIDAVYKPLSSDFSEKLMCRIRSRFGANPLPMKNTLREQVRKKNEAHTLAMVADQTPLKNEIQFWTNFLNQDTPFYVGADKIGKMLHMPVLFVGMRRIKRGYYEVWFEEIARPPFAEGEFSITETYAKVLEREIRKQPANWLWSHRRWKHQRIMNIESLLSG